MKTFDEIKKELSKYKKEITDQFGVKEIGIFGSFVRGEQGADSDLDILVEFEKPIGLVKFLKLENKLSELFGVRVELVTKKALKPYIGKRILQEVRYV